MVFYLYLIIITKLLIIKIVMIRRRLGQIIYFLNAALQCDLICVVTSRGYVSYVTMTTDNGDDHEEVTRDPLLKMFTFSLTLVRQYVII